MHARPIWRAADRVHNVHWPVLLHQSQPHEAHEIGVSLSRSHFSKGGDIAQHHGLAGFDQRHQQLPSNFHGLNSALALSIVQSFI